MYDDIYRCLKYYMVLDAYYKLEKQGVISDGLYFVIVVVAPPNTASAAARREELRNTCSDPRILDLLDRYDEFHYVMDEVYRLIHHHSCDQADLKASIPLAFQFEKPLYPSFSASNRVVPVDPHVDAILLKHLLLWNTNA